MVLLTKISRQQFLVNPDLIRLIETTPDTIITFVDGKRIWVSESPREIEDKILDYKRKCFSEQGQNGFEVELRKEG